MNNEMKELLKAAGMNVEDTMARFMNSESMYLKFLNKFLADDTMNQLEAAVRDRDYEQIFVAAHTLKGVAGNLGLDAIYEITVPMSDAYRNQVDESYPLEENMECLRERYAQVCEAIRKVVG